MLPLASLLLYISCAAAVPVLYDQRQDGEVNVHAQFEDVLVVLLPKMGDAMAAVPSLVNLFSRYPQGTRYPPEATPPPEFESSEGNKTAMVQAALEAAMQELGEIELHTDKTEQPMPTTSESPTTDKSEKS